MILCRALQSELGVVLSLLFLSAPAFAKVSSVDVASPEYYIKVVRSKKNRINHIKISTKSLVWLKDPQSFTPATELSGLLSSSNEGKLTINSSVVSIEGKNKKKFRHVVDLTGLVTPVEMSFIDSSGRVSSELVLLKMEKWDEFAKNSGTVIKKRHFFSAGFGPTYLNYTQTGKKTYHALTTTVKGSYRYVLSMKWDLAFNGFFNVVPLYQSRDDATIRFFGANARAGYSITWNDSPWRLGIMGGFYYVTMFVTDNKLGISNMMGPQVFPVLSRRLNNGSNVYAYAKFSPVSTDFSIRTLESREIAAGAGYSFKYLKKTNLSFMLDISNLQFAVQNRTAKSNSISLSVGIDF